MAAEWGEGGVDDLIGERAADHQHAVRDGVIEVHVARGARQDRATGGDVNVVLADRLEVRAGADRVRREREGQVERRGDDRRRLTADR